MFPMQIVSHVLALQATSHVLAMQIMLHTQVAYTADGPSEPAGGP